MLLIGKDAALKLLPVAGAISVVKEALTRSPSSQEIKQVSFQANGREITSTLSRGNAPGEVMAGAGLFVAAPGDGRAHPNGVVVVLDPASGRLDGVVDGSAVAELRAAAMAAIGADGPGSPEEAKIALLDVILATRIYQLAGEHNVGVRVDLRS
jgi:ornithine cyclodeaminase/alanine dehydrogenase-like protein (mu-crystallin family)